MEPCKCCGAVAGDRVQIDFLRSVVTIDGSRYVVPRYELGIFYVIYHSRPQHLMASEIGARYGKVFEVSVNHSLCSGQSVTRAWMRLMEIMLRSPVLFKSEKGTMGGGRGPLNFWLEVKGADETEQARERPAAFESPEQPAATLPTELVGRVRRSARILGKGAGASPLYMTRGWHDGPGHRVDHEAGTVEIGGVTLRVNSPAALIIHHLLLAGDRGVKSTALRQLIYGDDWRYKSDSTVKVYVSRARTEMIRYGMSIQACSVGEENGYIVILPEQMRQKKDAAA